MHPLCSCSRPPYVRFPAAHHGSGIFYASTTMDFHSAAYLAVLSSVLSLILIMRFIVCLFHFHLRFRMCLLFFFFRTHFVQLFYLLCIYIYTNCMYTQIPNIYAFIWTRIHIMQIHAVIIRPTRLYFYLINLGQTHTCIYHSILRFATRIPMHI